jgi:hypothetical protein
MAQMESRSNMETPALPHLTSAELAAMGEKRVHDFAEAQAVLFGTLQETHRRWLDRMQSEARLALEFTHKVTNARSIPDTVSACREWTCRHFEMMADDGKHLLADSQKIVETSARFLSLVDVAEEQSAGGAPGRDRPAGDRQHVRAFDHDEPAHSSPATVSGRRTAMSADGFDESRTGGGAASL